jgi:tetratricopeptide (TPR) repeat protein
MCRDRDRPAVALTYYQRAWASVGQVDAPVVEMNILVELAPLAATHGETARARAAAERLLTLLANMELPEESMRERKGLASQVLAYVAQQEGRLDDALALAQQAVALCRDASDPGLQGNAWRVLARAKSCCR